MYKLDPNKNYFIKNIKDLNKNFSYDTKYKIDTIKNLTNYFKKLK